MDRTILVPVSNCKVGHFELHSCHSEWHSILTNYHLSYELDISKNSSIFGKQDHKSPCILESANVDTCCLTLRKDINIYLSSETFSNALVLHYNLETFLLFTNLCSELAIHATQLGQQKLATLDDKNFFFLPPTLMQIFEDPRLFRLWHQTL